MDTDSSLLLLVIGGSLLFFIVFGYLFFRYINNTSRGNSIFNAYKTILDNKLLPLGFSPTQVKNTGREITLSYERGLLEVVLSSEPPLSNHVFLRKGAGLLPGTDIDLNLDSDDVRNKFSEMLDNWLKKNNDRSTR